MAQPAKSGMISKTSPNISKILMKFLPDPDKSVKTPKNLPGDSKN